MAMQGTEWPDDKLGPDTERILVPYVGMPREDDDDAVTLKSEPVPALPGPPALPEPPRAPAPAPAPKAWLGFLLWASALVVFLERHPLQALGILLLIAGTWWIVRDARVRSVL